jgi:hypothetical protein
MDLKEAGSKGIDRIHLAQDMYKWQVGPYESGNGSSATKNIFGFLDYIINC